MEESLNITKYLKEYLVKNNLTEVGLHDLLNSFAVTNKITFEKARRLFYEAEYNKELVLTNYYRLKLPDENNQYMIKGPLSETDLLNFFKGT